MCVLQNMTNSLRNELLQRCCLCRQWIASPSHIKAHIRRSHPEVYNMYIHDITSQCSLLVSLLQDPCPFCLQSVSSKHRDRHAIRCPVLVQLALCCCHNGGHSPGSRNRLSLRGTLAGIPGLATATAATVTSNRPRGTGTERGRRQAANEVAQTERQRRPQTTTMAAGPQPGNILWGGWREASGSQAQSQQETLQMLVQLTLRQEDAINVLRMDRGFLLLFKTQGQETVVRDNHRLAPEKGRQPSRPPSPHSLVKEPAFGNEDKAGEAHHISRAGRAHGKAGLDQAARKQAPSWLPLAYNPETKQEIPHPTLGPLEHADLMKGLEILFQHLNGQIMQRFHSTTQYKGEMLAFMLEVSNRGAEADRVHEALVSLCHLSAWHVIGARFRMELPKRSPLANRLQKMLPKQSRA